MNVKHGNGTVSKVPWGWVVALVRCESGGKMGGYT